MTWTRHDGRSDLEGERSTSVVDLCDYTIDLSYCPRRYAISTTHSLMSPQKPDVTTEQSIQSGSKRQLSVPPNLEGQGYPA